MDYGDGCSSICQVETGWNCTGTPSVCTIKCGDGIKVSTEACDDGNATDGLGCKADCSGPLDGISCTGGNSTSPDTCSPLCGDGKMIPPEDCDDGADNGEGCKPGCKSCALSTWNCTGGTTTT